MWEKKALWTIKVWVRRKEDDSDKGALKEE